MIEFSLPIYYGKKKSELLSINKYLRTHFIVANEIKKYYDHLFFLEKVKKRFRPIQGKYEIEYILFFKNKKCDLMNVVSIIDKFVNDSLQNYGLVENDNVQYHVKSTISVGGQDKTNPRIEIRVKGVNYMEYILYTKGNCKYCEMAKKVIKNKNLNIELKEITEDDKNFILSQGIKQLPVLVKDRTVLSYGESTAEYLFKNINQI